MAPLGKHDTILIKIYKAMSNNEGISEGISEWFVHIYIFGENINHLATITRGLHYSRNSEAKIHRWWNNLPGDNMELREGELSVARTKWIIAPCLACSGQLRQYCSWILQSKSSFRVLIAPLSISPRKGKRRVEPFLANLPLRDTPFPFFQRGRIK